MRIYRAFLLLIIGYLFVSCEKQATNPEIDFDLIKNGGFEKISGGEPPNWMLQPNTFGNQENYILIDSVDACAGKNCLKFHHSEKNGCYEMCISQVLDRSRLMGGATYKFSLSLRADYTDNNTGLAIILRNPTMDLDLWIDLPFKIEKQGEWLELSKKVTLPHDIGSDDIKLDIWFCNPGIKSWWLDNIRFQ